MTAIRSTLTRPGLRWRSGGWIFVSSESRPLEAGFSKYPPEIEAKFADFHERFVQYDKDHGRYNDGAT